MKRLLLCLILMGTFASVQGAPKYIPVVNGSFLTGQWFFEGQDSAMGGNAEITFIPALRYSSQFSLIPSIESSYRGTRSAQELAGGNTLFSDTWDNSINLKAVHALSSEWKIKERLGVGIKWFRETTDETWSDGLYDYQTISAGFEVENRISQRSSWVVGYDLSLLKFPNYESLESNQSSDMSREYAGDNPLDNLIHLASLQINMPLFLKMSSRIQAYYSPRYYSDQTVVQTTGLLSSSKREDTLSGGVMMVERPWTLPDASKLVASASLGYSQMDSNQNHYDANQTIFVPHYYSYDQNRAGGAITWAFGKLISGPMLLETGLSYLHRSYSDRVIQSESGIYLNEKLYTNETAVNVSFSYPLSKVLRLRLSSSWGKSTSNNRYEELYRYNYETANYLFGFTYDY